MSDALDNDTSFWDNLQKRAANVKKTADRQPEGMNPYVSSGELMAASLGQTAGFLGDVLGELFLLLCQTQQSVW